MCDGMVYRGWFRGDGLEGMCDGMCDGVV
jgi:hypothetical protein